MDFNKPIYGEILENEKEVLKFRKYLQENNIKFTETTEDYMTIDGAHFFFVQKGQIPESYGCGFFYEAIIEERTENAHERKD